MTHQEREQQTIDRLRAYQDSKARDKETVRRLQEYRSESSAAAATASEALEVDHSSHRMLVIDLDKSRIDGSLEDALKELIGNS